MKILVLGGCGFIGSHVVDRLIRDGQSVRVLDRKPETGRPPLPGVDYVLGSFSDPMVMADALFGMDAVVHLVSTTFPSTADLDPSQDVRDNLVGTLGLLDLMAGLSIRRLVFLSSGGTVYGVPTQIPIPESAPLQPIGSYGIVKTAIEHYIDMYRRNRGISPVVLRASNPYGPRQGHTGVQGVVSTYLNRLAGGGSIEVWGDGSVVRDYIHVGDLADLAAAAVRSEIEGVFNAGSGEGTALNDLIGVIARVTGREIVPVYRPARPNDVPRSVLDVTKVREALGWRATRSLEDGIRETCDWMLCARE
jgi:UDP-glucose 4-epimerase